MKKLLLLITPLLYTTLIYTQCNAPITLNNISDQNSCGADLVTLTASANAMPEDNLVITSVFDGPLTGGTPKGVELYVINDINDLSEYGIGSANNGGGTDGEEFTFPPVTAAAGDYIYLASESTQFNNWFGFNADYVTGVMGINGDDALELFHGGSVIDVFGDINVDGNGQPWEYLDGWAYRNSSTGPDGGIFALANWSFSGPNALDGELLNSTAAIPIPFGVFTHTGFSVINTYAIDVAASSSTDYTFAGDFSGSDPAININLGDTLIFNVNSPNHPFWINATQGTGASNGVVVTNNGTSSGTIAWVPTATGTFYYNCQFHSMMTNTITVGPSAVTYAWDNGVTNGVPFTPTATGDYIVVASDAFGCTATETVTVTVYPNPTVGAGMDQTICEGDQVTLSGSGAVSFSWDNSITDGVAFAPASSTTYTVIGTDANGCENTDQVAINVNPLPTLDAGADQSVCDGDQVTLSGSGASSYTWDNGISDGVAFSPLLTATYTLNGTDANGCENSDQVDVTVNPLPAVDAGADQSVCEGDQATLSGSGASTYTWDNGVTDGVAFIAATATTYTVTGTDVNGCANTDMVTVTVPAVQTITGVVTNDDGTSSGGIDVTIAGGAPPYIIAWDNSETTDDITGLAANDYTITVTDDNGCVASMTFTVLSTVGIATNISEELNIYPNPTSDQITIDIKGYHGVVNIEVYDLQGRLLETTRNTTISLEKHAKGIYVFRVSYGEITELVRVVRE